MMTKIQKLILAFPQYFSTPKINKMKKTEIGKLKDGASFQLSKRSQVIYEVIKKEKGWVLFTSMSSNKSFKRKNNTVCYV